MQESILHRECFGDGLLQPSTLVFCLVHSVVQFRRSGRRFLFRSYILSGEAAPPFFAAWHISLWGLFLRMSASRVSHNWLPDWTCTYPHTKLFLCQSNRIFTILSTERHRACVNAQTIEEREHILQCRKLSWTWHHPAKFHHCESLRWTWLGAG